MKILIVEDSMFVRNVIKKVILENIPNCEVLTANDGESGFNLYQEYKPDLITTDLLMPNLSGQDLLKKIREIDKETKVIVISADVQKATRDEIEELGILGFINKPVTGEKADLLINLIKGV
ncbi:response regulator transcription factor [Schinkia azotoformans]|uniref:response regulator transcription factor n=1 Tax=Schinkia azotoformans TaxID=1454 RepID=UPI002DBAF6EB|nr:response regulator [Schinkia azotoformans]MEC1719029.1 response regulator [Schinkia azotoformans]MED4411941.1 response regulator [Schinkia azotoformans]